jgi:hypothetical protein
MHLSGRRPLQHAMFPFFCWFSYCLCLRCFAGWGKELPEHARVSDDAGANRDRLIEFINAQGIDLEFNERIAPAMGMSYGGKIVLLPGQSKAEEFSCLVHELSH